MRTMILHCHPTYWITSNWMHSGRYPTASITAGCHRSINRRAILAPRESWGFSQASCGRCGCRRELPVKRETDKEQGELHQDSVKSIIPHQRLSEFRKLAEMSPINGLKRYSTKWKMFPSGNGFELPPREALSLSGRASSKSPIFAPA